ncbi:MAG: DUF1624 domain-containing protein [Planctomycetes bacterium]|nr:DUF1624 domain-containing protein [Planctomycetota bacterium]
MTSLPGRIRALDWHRGLAVIVMIECHSLVTLSPSLDAHPLRQWLNRLNGLVAPSFIFAAGFSLALVMGRAALEPAGRGRRAVKSLVRIAEVFAVALLMAAAKWPVLREPAWLLRVDILACIAGSLLILWIFVTALAGRTLAVAGAMLACAALVFGASPWTETLRGGGAVHILNASTGSPFPLVPWSGYGFLGACLGSVAAVPERGLRWARRGFAAMFVAGLALACAGPLLDRLYASPTAVLTNAGERVWKVAAIALSLLALEALGQARGWALKNPVTGTLEFYGTSSLSAYAFHLFLLYGSVKGLSLGARFHGALGWTGFWFATVLVIAATGLACRAWDVVDRKLPWKARKAISKGEGSSHGRI